MRLRVTPHLGALGFSDRPYNLPHSLQFLFSGVFLHYHLSPVCRVGSLVLGHVAFLSSIPLGGDSRVRRFSILLPDCDGRSLVAALRDLLRIRGFLFK